MWASRAKDTLVGFPCHGLVFKHIILPSQNSAATPALAMFFLQPPLPRCVLPAPAFPIREGRAGALCLQPVATPVAEATPVPAGGAGTAPFMLLRALLEQLCDLTPLHEGFAAEG